MYANSLKYVNMIYFNWERKGNFNDTLVIFRRPWKW